MQIKSLSTENFLAKFEEYIFDALTPKQDYSVLDDAMRYATLDGGKRVRPTAVYLGAKAVLKGELKSYLENDILLDKILSLSTAIEMIHCYSLIHDDLPAMDNDDYRRGKLSTHKKYGEANGILAGDQLLTLSSCLLLEKSAEYGEEYAKAASEIVHAARDMADGQAIELCGVHTKNEYLEMYEKKTGALIVGAFKAGAIVAGADKSQIFNVEEYAKHIGLAFQLADDLLDEGEDGRIFKVVDKSEIKDMLKTQTKLAMEICDNFQNTQELKNFAKKLEDRRE